MLTDVRADVAIDTLAGVEIIVVIELEFAVFLSYFADVLFDVAVDAFMGALADVIMNFVTDIGVEVLAGVIMDFVPGIGVELLADANANVFASLMPALEFVAPKP